MWTTVGLNQSKIGSGGGADQRDVLWCQNAPSGEMLLGGGEQECFVEARRRWPMAESIPCIPRLLPGQQGVLRPQLLLQRLVSHSRETCSRSSAERSSRRSKSAHTGIFRQDLSETQATRAGILTKKCANRLAMVVA